MSSPFIPSIPTIDGRDIPTTNVFAELCSTYPTWSLLREFLSTTEGGKLNVYEMQDSPHLAMIRYSKDVSDMTLPHVRAFRSVVWNTETNRPVGVTSWKSETGEGLPDLTGVSDTNTFRVEEFVDGVMIGQFYDPTTSQWRIHTRSSLDARCRYYSKTHTFAQLFHQVAEQEGIYTLLEQVPKDRMFTWILSHPENRIVCNVPKPRLTLVDCFRCVDEAGTVALESVPLPLLPFEPTRYNLGHLMSYTEHTSTNLDTVLRATVSICASIYTQGIVLKMDNIPFRRWKLRSPAYNRVRRLRGNTARLDFLWMSLWSQGTLGDYLNIYTEECEDAQAVVNRWKEVTQTTYNTYVEVFKARTCPRDLIPRKIKPLVMALHQEYLNVLRPAKKPLDWRTAVQFLNMRDTAQKIYILNWDLRQEIQHLRSAASIPCTASSL